MPDAITPRISVLLSVYNGEDYLRAAIDSVLAQTMADFEFLILDDGSTDGTAGILAECAERDARIQLFRNQPNQGICRAMNRLFGLARAAYVTRHDADDLSLPDRLERQWAYLEANPEVGVLATRVQIIDPAGQPAPDQTSFNQGSTHEELSELLLTVNCLCQGSVMMRRDCLDAVGYYDESLQQSEDYDLWLRLSEVTRLAKLPQPLYHYRSHDESVTRLRWHQTVYDHARVLDKAIQRRHGPTLPDRPRLAVIDSYLDAARRKIAAGELAPARHCMERVMALDSTFGLANPERLEPVLAALIKSCTFKTALDFGQWLFSHLPASAPLQRRHARWLAQLNMRQVFDLNQRAADPRRIRQHLWAGVRHDPAWLLNRGVIAIGLRALLAGR